MKNFRFITLFIFAVIISLGIFAAPYIVRAQETETPITEEVVAPDVEITDPAPTEEPLDPTPVVEESVLVPSTTLSSIQTPELSTDKADYHPGDTVTIFGKFFGALQDFVLKVFGSDDNDQNYTETIANVTTDQNGYFSTAFNLDNLYRPFYEMVASTPDGTQLASGWFRDSAVGTYDQCSNDAGTGYTTGDTGCRWTNGNLQANNSLYQEGDSTVQRLWLEGLSPGTEYTVTFQYGTTKQGKHAYDYLTTWNASENWITEADLCQGITGGCTALGLDLDKFDIPFDTNVLVPQPSNSGDRQFVMDGGDITSAVISAVNGSYLGDSETSITLTFTTDPSTGNMCSTKTVKGQPVTSCGAALWFGAHIAKGDEWNLANGTTGAGSIPGSPYHVALSAIDGASVGQRDNQMQANAIVVPTTSTLTLQKTVTNDNGGTALDTAWTLAASGPTPISGVEGAPAVTNATVTAGTYTLSESGGPSGYTNGTIWSCAGTTVTSGNQITLAAGESATCTINNNDNAPSLTLNKIVVNDNGGAATPENFTLTATGPTGFSGVGPTVNNGASFDTGTYTLSESGPAGYAASAWVCTGGTQSGNQITLALGQSASCTITNNDIAPKLTVTKVVINDNGGTKVVSDFPLFVDTTGVTSGTQNTFSLGLHTVSETSQAGYTMTGISGDCASDGTVTLALGDVKSCTITNNDIPAHLIVIKHVVNDNGGTALANAFSTTISGVTTVAPTAAGVEAPGVDNALTSVGSYSVDEGAHVGYDKTLSTGCSGTIALGETKTCTITNDDQPGHLIVHKVTNPSSDTTTVFSITASGGTIVSPTATQSITGGGQVNYTVNAGTYNVSEAALAGWQVTGNTCTNVVIANGETKECTITNTKLGKITIIKDAQPNDTTDFNFTTTGTGLSNFSLDDDGGVQEGGDNTLLNTKVFSNLLPGTFSVTEGMLGQYWKLKNVSCVGGTTNIVGSTASITLDVGNEVTCTFVNEKINPTRTQGFWQTHTAFTSTIFAKPSMQNYIGVYPHKGIIGNLSTTGGSDLFGAFYSNIAKKSTGAQRLPIDKSRMQLLQQLVAAKLNCTAFGCTPSVITMIAAADAAYAGNDQGLIQSYISQIDAYNNSGDTIIIAGTPGKATPKTSQSLANKTFWDNP